MMFFYRANPFRIGTTVMRIAEEGLLQEGRWPEGLTVLAAAAGVLVQVQFTLPVDEAAIRLNLADPLVAIASPVLLLILGLRHRRELLQLAGTPLILAVLAATAALTVSLLTGRAAIHEWQAWALIKYAGWFVLLGYALFGAMLSAAGGLLSQQAVTGGVIGLQLLLFPVFCISMGLWLLWPVQYGFRLQGLADNPNAMALLCLAGFSLAIGFHDQMVNRIGGFGAAAVTGALAAMVLLTRSIAGALALILLVFAVLLFRLLPLKPIVMAFVACMLLWFAPQRLQDDVANNVVVKTYMIVSESKHERAQGFLTGSRVGRLESYRLAFDQWLANPVFGAGLGAHMAAQPKSMSPDVMPVQVHNTPLWLAAEAGLFGLLSFTALFGVIAWRLGRTFLLQPPQFEGRAIVIAASLTLLSAVVAAMFHEMLYQRILWFMLGLALPYTLPAAWVGQSARKSAVSGSK
ncbi:MAG: O-antigen ligase family protein [Pseudomonadota bacterium]|nr:O-antigen ligase family protein [Pseudomonadota bacterium]